MRPSAAPVHTGALRLNRAYPVVPETAPSRRFLEFDDLNDLQTCISLQIREALNKPRLMILKAERNS